MELLFAEELMTAKRKMFLLAKEPIAKEPFVMALTAAEQPLEESYRRSANSQ